ncbi:MAG: 3-hydroxyacyl-CoA dehydrogenase family protein [Chloroflexi bacterium]|nr:3-hydroxyacyl-CoA dehydrogenase family protein [Chloroflexota bacterium]
MQINKIAVIGAGIMGHGIAHTYAQYGFNVVLVDTNDEILKQARNESINEIDMLTEEGLVTDEVDIVLSRMQFTTDLKNSVSDVDYVEEAVSEDLDLKKDIYKKLDKFCPSHTILASNTSFLPIRDLAAATRRSDKVIGAHWVNPPHIIPLVELVPTSDTSDETIQTTVELHKSCNKAPAVLARDAHGFMPRLLAVLLNEAIACLEEGLASAEEIDKMVSNSFGFRLPTLGPLRGLDYWNLELFKAATDHLVVEYNDERYRSPKLVETMVEQGKLSMKVGEGFYNYKDVDILQLRLERDRKYCKQLKVLRDAGAI